MCWENSRKNISVLFFSYYIRKEKKTSILMATLFETQFLTSYIPYNGIQFVVEKREVEFEQTRTKSERLLIELRYALARFCKSFSYIYRN